MCGYIDLLFWFGSRDISAIVKTMHLYVDQNLVQ
jgi:hypothetical protein